MRAGDDGGPAQQGVGWLVEDASRCTRTQSTGAACSRNTGGPKHRRAIVLEGWQTAIALDRHPYLLLRRVLQSDGWRGTNRVPGGHEYTRYLFCNRSPDIRELFQVACHRTAIECRPSGRRQVAVARRQDVARFDLFVGAKR